LYQALDPNQFEISILAHEKVGNFLQNLDENININFVKERPYRRTDLPLLLAATIRYAREADIILGANEGRATFLGLLAAKLLRKPIIAWLHFDWSQFVKTQSWRQLLSLKMYVYVDRIVACSQGVADSFSKLVGVDPSRIHTIYNGMLAEKIQQEADEPLSDSVSIFEQPTVITVGRLEDQKGHEYLIEAHALLLRKGIQHNLVIIGKGTLLDKLQEQAASLGVSSSVHFLSFQNNPYKFIKNASVFALSSRFEGMPFVLIEALFCGTPIVSADCPSGPYEILEAGKYGVLVKSEDPKELADGIEAVLCDDAKREQLAKLSLMRSEAFDQRKIAAQWEALFRDLAQGIA
jgi:glycosyltransferase involved in cell wall biosynthesis